MGSKTFHRKLLYILHLRQDPGISKACDKNFFQLLQSEDSVSTIDIVQLKHTHTHTHVRTYQQNGVDNTKSTGGCSQTDLGSSPGHFL